MNKLGYNASLIVPDRKKGRETGVSDVFKYYGVEPFSYQYFPWFNFKGGLYIYSMLLAIWLRTRSKDLIFSRDFYPAVFSTLFGSRVVMEFHSPPKFGKGFMSFLIKRFYKSPNLKGIIVISEALKQIFVENGFDGSRIIVAHDGSDPVNLSDDDFSMKGVVKVGYVGHLYKGRGVENIIYLAEQNPEIDFHIAGGNESDIDYWQTRCRVIGNLHFHGFISPSKTDSFRKACDILLAPYQKDLAIWGGGSSTSAFMSPLKIFEYMAAGKAIVCSNLPVLREVMNSSNSILVEPENLDAWNEALRKLINNAEFRDCLGKKAQKDFEENYSWKMRAKNILGEIENCKPK